MGAQSMLQQLLKSGLSQAAATSKLAAPMVLASLPVTDETGFMERALTQPLKLPADLASRALPAQAAGRYSCSQGSPSKRQPFKRPR